MVYYIGLLIHHVYKCIVIKENLINLLFILLDGVTVVLYNVMQTYNRMDVIEADQVLSLTKVLRHLNFVMFVLPVFLSSSILP